MSKNLKIEKYISAIRLEGAYNSSLPITTTSTLTATGITNNGASSNTGGITQSTTNKSSVFHSGGTAPFSGVAATSGATNASIVTTETYVCEVYIPANSTITGISVLNGTAVAGNLNVGLANSAGTIVAQSATTTAASGTSTYQQVPFTTPYSAIGPGKYFILLQGSNTSGRYNAHTIGNFGATKVTGETYGTFLTTASYSTTTFTTAIAPVADVY